MVKNLSDNIGDIRGMGSIPGSGRSPGGRQGDPLLDRIPRTEKAGGLQSLGSQSSRTRLKQLSIHTRKDTVGLPEHSYFLGRCYLLSAFEISLIYIIDYIHTGKKLYIIFTRVNSIKLAYLLLVQMIYIILKR